MRANRKCGQTGCEQRELGMSWQQTFLFASEPCNPVATAAPPTKRSRKQRPCKQRAAKKTANNSLAANVPATNCASSVLPAEPTAVVDAAVHCPVDPLARVDQLRRLVRRMEGRGAAIDAPEPVVFSAGGPVLDAWLPHGGLRPGTLVEWVCDAPRAGASLLAMIAAASVLGHEASGNRPLVVVDGLGDAAHVGNESFYPPAAISLGIAADSMMIIRKQRGHTRGDLIWAIDQSLRSGAVAAVYAEIGDWLDPADARRLQLAAETGGAVGLFVRPMGRPIGLRRQPGSRPAANPAAATRASFADVRWIVSPLPGHGGRRLQVELDRCRGGVMGGSRVIEIGVAADRLTGYGAANGEPRLGPTVAIREVKHQEVAGQNAAARATGARVGGASDAATKMVSDLVGRLADPAAKARSTDRQQQPAQRSADRRHAG
jgi:protein ImuA